MFQPDNLAVQQSIPMNDTYENIIRKGSMTGRMINIGFGNSVVASRILAVVNPKSSPIKKLKDEARENNRLIDATEGRRTRSIIILDTCHVVLSSVQPETISLRYFSHKSEDGIPSSSPMRGKAL